MKLVYVSSVSWDSYAQRPHFMIEHFAERTGGEVLWIDPYPGRLPRAGDLRRRIGSVEQRAHTETFVRPLSVPALPVEPLIGGVALNRYVFWRQIFRDILEFVDSKPWVLGIGRPNGLALHILEELVPSCSFFDALDDFPEFYRGLSRTAMLRRELRIVDQVDQIFVTTSYIGTKFQDWADKTVLVGNACDTENLSLRPGNRQEEGVVGYIGTIGEWFDWNMVLVLAHAFPHLRVRLVGPAVSRPPFDLPSNVEMTGACRQEQVGDHLAGFSVGLIPFKLNRLTRSVDPIKYYEYRAMGLPVLTTSFGEMKRRDGNDGVFFLDGPDGVEKAMLAALNFVDTTQAVLEFRRRNSWAERFSSAGLFEVEGFVAIESGHT